MPGSRPPTPPAPPLRRPTVRGNSCTDSFNARTTFSAGEQHYEIFSLRAVEAEFPVSGLPYSLKILLENLLRHEDGTNVSADDIAALAGWDPATQPATEIAFTPPG